MRRTCLVLLLLLILGCGAESTPTVVPAPTRDVAATVVASHWMTATAEAARAPTATATDTPTPTVTATPTDTPTPTPLPAAQLEGQVLDEGSNQPLAGAQVAAGERQTTTDPEGRFLFADLAPGQYTVLITSADHDPVLSGIVDLRAGEQVVVDAALPAAGTGDYPRDPMASNQIDPAGAPTAEEAERLARLQGLQGEVVSVRELMLEGEHLVNYRKGDAIRSAMANLHHPAWELVDGAGQAWYIIRVCGNLAVVRPAPMEVPSECVAQPHPVVTVGGGGAVGRACPEEGCDVVAELPVGWHGVALGCSAGCEWLQVQGPGVADTCWVRAELLQSFGEASALPVALPVATEPAPTATMPPTAPLGHLTWSEPQSLPLSREQDYTWWPVMAADGLGRVHVAWVGAQWAISYTRWEDGAWATPERISGQDAADFPAIVAHSDGQVWVTWEKSHDSSGIWLRRWQNGWQSMQMLSGSEDTEDSESDVTSMALDSRGEPHVAWGSADRVGYNSGGISTIPVPGLLGGFPGLAVDLNGSTFVASYRGGPRVVERTVDGTWSQPQIMGEGSGLPSLAADARGRVHMAWCDGSRLFYSVHTDGQWSQPRLVARLAHGACDAMGVGLAVDAGGNAHLVAGVDKDGAVYIGQSNGSWSEPQTIYGQMTDRAVIAIDTEGRLHVVLWPAMLHTVGVKER